LNLPQENAEIAKKRTWAAPPPRLAFTCQVKPLAARPNQGIPFFMCSLRSFSAIPTTFLTVVFFRVFGVARGSDMPFRVWNFHIAPGDGPLPALKCAEMLHLQAKQAENRAIPGATKNVQKNRKNLLTVSCPFEILTTHTATTI
jgi:hypothetical protein